MRKLASPDQITGRMFACMYAPDCFFKNICRPMYFLENGAKKLCCCVLYVYILGVQLKIVFLPFLRVLVLSLLSFSLLFK